MSINDFPLDDPERREMARPWRARVWDRLPDWAKIVLWAILGLVMAEVLLGIRVWYGLQDLRKWLPFADTVGTSSSQRPTAIFAIH